MSPYIGEQGETFVADGHLDGIHLTGCQYDILWCTNYGDGDGKFFLIGLVQGQIQPEDACEYQKENEYQDFLVRLTEQEIPDNLPHLFHE